MKIEFAEFKNLRLEVLYDLLKLRAEVFVVEQSCIYNDLDELDQHAIHCLVYNDKKLVGYCRILKPNTRFKKASIGRVVVQAQYRKMGIASEMIKKSVEFITHNWKEKEIMISAQLHLENYYFGLGFIKCSEQYLEDGIPHIEMKLAE